MSGRNLSTVDVKIGPRPGDFSTTWARRVALDDERRCQARRMFKTVPRRYWPLKCWKVAQRGSMLCAQCKKAKAYVRTSHLPTFYKSHLSKTLSDALSAVAENEQQALELREELRLMRVMANDAVVLYGKALDMREVSLDDKTRESAQAVVDQAGEAMKTALKEVTDQVLTAAKVESLSRDVFSPTAVKQLVDQIVRIAYDACGEEHQDIAERFDDMMRRDLKLLTFDPKGTTITPDQDVLEMDQTIPSQV